MAEPEIRYLGGLKKIDCQAGDVFVLELNHHLSEQAQERVRAQLKSYFPAHRVLIVDGGAKLGVIRSHGYFGG